MKSKRTILLACLVLVMFVFTAASADGLETVTTISMESGELLAEFPQVAQILDIATIHLRSMPEGYGAFALSLSDTDVLQLLLKNEQDGIYAYSGSLGEQPLYFAYEDIAAAMMELMESYGDLQPVDMPYDMSTMQAMMNGSLTDEQVFDMMGIDEDLLAYLTEIQNKMVTENGTFALHGSDTANQKSALDITNEDIVRMLDIPIVRNQINEQTMLSSPESTQEDIDLMVDTQLAEMKQTIEDSNIELSYTVYTFDDEFVALQLDMTGDTEDYIDGTVPMNLSVMITRTSIDTAKYYQMSFSFSEDGNAFLNQTGSLYISDAFVSGQYVLNSSAEDPALEVTLNCDRSQEGLTDGELSFTVYDSYFDIVQSVFVIFSQQQAENITNTDIDVYVGGSVDDIKAALEDLSLISVNLHTVTQPDSGFFAALQSATPDTAVQLLQIGDEEFENYLMGMQQNLMMTLMAVLENLPPDVSEALLQDMELY